MSHISPRVSFIPVKATLWSAATLTCLCCGTRILNNPDRLELVKGVVKPLRRKLWMAVQVYTLLEVSASGNSSFPLRMHNCEPSGCFSEWGKEPAAKPGDLSYVSGAHLVGGEDCLFKTAICPQPAPHIHKYKWNKYLFCVFFLN